MKKLAILLFVLLIVKASAFSQGCLPEGITFTTQAQIDNFQTNYPGCNVIQGSVSIQGENINSITNLYGLNVLTSIQQNLTILINGALTSLTGLDNLTSIGWSLSIFSNGGLTNLSGLNNLTTIGGQLSIQDENAMLSLSGLENLTSLGQLLLRRCKHNNAPSKGSIKRKVSFIQNSAQGPMLT